MIVQARNRRSRDLSPLHRIQYLTDLFFFSFLFYIFYGYSTAHASVPRDFVFVQTEAADHAHAHARPLTSFRRDE